MAEPTLLPQARQRLEMAKAVPYAERSARVFHIGIAVDRILQYLEKPVPQQVPGPNEAPLVTAATRDQVERWPQVRQARRELGELVDGVHERIRRGGEPELSEQEIQNEIDALDLDALQKLCDAATPAPWDCDFGDYNVLLAPDGERVMVAAGDRHWATHQFNASFIAAARDALPKLIAEVRQLRKERDRAKKRLRWETTKDDAERVRLERELFGGEHA
jgi:hypothetical protein